MPAKSYPGSQDVEAPADDEIFNVSAFLRQTFTRLVLNIVEVLIEIIP